MTRDIRILPDSNTLCRAAATEFARLAAEAVESKGSFNVLLSGGSTPKAMYLLLANDPVLRGRTPWKAINFFWGDERHVPPDDPESNFRAANEILISKVPVSPSQVWRIKSELPEAADAAREYEQTLRVFFDITEAEMPNFDLALLGMGPEGHTASLFPGTTALRERRRLVVSNWVGKLYTERITVTVPVLNNASSVLFLVQGEDKAPALKAVLEGPFEPDQLPAQLISPKSERLLWLIDQAAARMLKPAS